jgi:tRNA threonylcarbamoyladenosine biosynthesis protein TsaB
MILAIKTNQEQAELYLYENNKIIDSYKWQAHRQLADTIHIKIQDLLSKNDISYADLEGLIIYQGPGSFTGLRIGISVFNTIAYILNIPIVACDGDYWLKVGLVRLQNNHNDKIALPLYGGNANITLPKK